MVKKKGQRKFLLKCGYTDDQLNHMSPSVAHNISSEIEKREHPQGCGNSPQVNQEEVDLTLDLISAIDYDVKDQGVDEPDIHVEIDYKKAAERLIRWGWHRD